jgi:hypothetical protein
MKSVTCILLFAASGWAQPVIKSVCASGCDFSNLQSAIDAAQRGWVLELKAGENYDTNNSWRLTAKPGTGWITIRSNRLRDLPAGRRATPSDAVFMPKLRMTTGAGAFPVIRTLGTNVTYWRLEGLEVTLSAVNLGHAGELIRLGDIASELRPDQVSSHFDIDRCYIHGLPFDQGPGRGIAHNANHVRILNSHIDEIKLLAATAESQVVAGWSFAGPLEIRNNYIAGGSIATLTGGSRAASPLLTPMFLRYVGNQMSKQASHLVVRYAANPAGPVFPTTGTLPTGGPVNSQPFWRTDLGLMYVYNAGTTTWVPVDGVQPGEVCFSGSFWRNESASPTYWECQSGMWVAVGADRTATGIGGAAFQGWGFKNLWELKQGIGVLLEGNFLHTSYYPTFLNQFGAAMLINYLPGQSGLTTTVRDVDIRLNRVRDVPTGVQMGGLATGGTISTATNATAARFTASLAHGLSPSLTYVLNIEGATGLWSGANGRWVATPVNSTDFTIPFNSTGLGGLTGSVRFEDEAIKFSHQLPSRIRIEQNLWDGLGTMPSHTNANCCATFPNDSGALYSVTQGRALLLAFPDVTFDHNTIIRRHLGPSFHMGTMIMPTQLPLLSWYDRVVRGFQANDNLHEGANFSNQVVRATGGQNGCDGNLDTNLRSPLLRRNVIVNSSQWADGASASTYDGVCPDWAWPWRASGSGVRAAAISASVSGGFLTLNFGAGGHGLLQGTRFRIVSASPSGIVGTYIVPTLNPSGVLTQQTNTQLRVATTAAAGSYTAVEIAADAGLTNYSTRNYRMAAGSLYKNQATDGSDPGASQDMVEWATETAESGLSNPYLDFQVRGLRTTATTATLEFTGYSTNACTWQVSTSRGFPTADGSVSQTRAGRSGTAVVTGLTRGQTYWYRVTCDGRYREGWFTAGM